MSYSYSDYGSYDDASSSYNDSYSAERPEFTTPLCSCAGDPCDVAYAWCCPCCAVGAAMSNYSETNCIFSTLCAPPPASRNIMREGYGIDGDCTGDICAGVFCLPCVARQMLYESRERGEVKPMHTRSTLKKAKSSRNMVSGRRRGGAWSMGVCELCHDGLGPACRALFCGPCFASQVRTTYNRSDWCFNFLCMTSCLIRNSIREQQRISGNCCFDVCIGTFCYPCAIVQFAHEVDNVVKARTVGPLAEGKSTAQKRIKAAWKKGPKGGRGSSKKKGGPKGGRGGSKKGGRGSSKKGGRGGRGKSSRSRR